MHINYEKIRPPFRNFWEIFIILLPFAVIPVVYINRLFYKLVRVIPRYYLWFTGGFQSVPNGRPELIQPSLAKQDLGQLKKDIVKYEIAGAIKSDDLVQWKEDISGIENRFGSTPQSSGWILDSITMVDERCVAPPQKDCLCIIYMYFRFTASSTIDVPVNPRIQNYASKYTNHRPVSICNCYQFNLI